MLPHYADGSKKDPAGKNKGRRKKEVAPWQVCVGVMMLVWLTWPSLPGLRGNRGAHGERAHGTATRGFVGLSMLGPDSAGGRWWLARVTAYFASVEAAYPVRGWTDETEKSLGRYSSGEFLEQILAREREIAEEVREKVRLFAQPAHDDEAATLDQEAKDGAESLPEGSYRGSCEKCAVVIAPASIGSTGLTRPSRPQLKCACRDGMGNLQDSIYFLDECSEYEWIGNLNGVLACEPLPKSASADELKAMRAAGNVRSAEKAEELAAKEAVCVCVCVGCCVNAHACVYDGHTRTHTHTCTRTQTQTRAHT